MHQRFTQNPTSTGSRSHWLWRTLPALCAVVMGLTAFQLGADMDARPGMPDANPLTQMYAILTLFVLGGVDLGMPTGGSNLASGLLWAAYFIAPAVTIITLVEAFLASLEPGWWQRKRLKNHIIIVGAGRLGTLYLQALRAEEPHSPVLVVDREPSRQGLAEHFNATFLCGDIEWNHTIAQLMLPRARGVILMTRDDIQNLTLASDIIERAPHLASKIVVHLGDLGLKRTLKPEHLPSHINRLDTVESGRDHMFNSHRVAAQHLIENQLRTHFSLTQSSDLVVLAGFGRFNQTILELLQTQASQEFHAVVVVDKHAELLSRMFSKQIGFGDLDVSVVQGDLNDPAVWQEVDNASADVSEPAYVVGTDNDSLNLHTALKIRQTNPEARIIVRCFEASTFAQQLASDASLEITSVASLVRESLQVQHRQWFKRMRN